MNEKILKIYNLLAKEKAHKVDLETLSKILSVEKIYRNKYGLTHETVYLYDCKVSHISDLLKAEININLADLANILKIEKDLRTAI